WPGLACIMTTSATASLGSLAGLFERDDLRLREVRDFFVLRLAMARDCTASARGIGNRSANFAAQEMLAGRFGGFVRGVDYDLAFFAHAHAFGADAGDIFEGEVDDAAFARGHGIQTERLVRSFDAFGGHFC